MAARMLCGVFNSRFQLKPPPPSLLFILPVLPPCRSTEGYWHSSRESKQRSMKTTSGSSATLLIVIKVNAPTVTPFSSDLSQRYDSKCLLCLIPGFLQLAAHFDSSSRKERDEIAAQTRYKRRLPFYFCCM